MFDQSFLLRQVKQSVIINNKTWYVRVITRVVD